MKNDVISYEWTYQWLKNKIERGILPVGAKLPRRVVLCKKFGTSEQTIQYTLELLEQDSFLEISPQKRSAAISTFALPGQPFHIPGKIGYNTPTIIKYPFWQMTAKNRTAIYACINYGGKLNAPREIQKQSICIDGDIGKILKQLSRA